MPGSGVRGQGFRIYVLLVFQVGFPLNNLGGPGSLENNPSFEKFSFSPMGNV